MLGDGHNGDEKERKGLDRQSRATIGMDGNNRSPYKSPQMDLLGWISAQKSCRGGQSHQQRGILGLPFLRDDTLGSHQPGATGVSFVFLYLLWIEQCLAT